MIASAQDALVTNIASRKTTSLNGKWSYIVDPYETGFYDYRRKERNVADPEAYWNTDVPSNKSDRKEHGYIDKYTLRVPGDWNSQHAKFLYYEGTVWYKKSFDYKKSNPANTLLLYFGAVNYEAHVYLNGKKLGSHNGGFSPFHFEVPDSLLKSTGNFLVVKVDNQRRRDEIPTINTDWWNYGGITRDVLLVELPSTHLQNYQFSLAKGGGTVVEGWLKFNRPPSGEVTVEIPELSIKKGVTVAGDSVAFRFTAAALKLWSPTTPKLYNVLIRTATETIQDKIGFRTIEVQGKKILLNGKPLFMRGICLHEEMPEEGRRAYSAADARKLLGQAKALNANMVRLAHYPHNEHMTRTADSLGLLLWSEIPVYWTIDFTSADVLAKATAQLTDMIARDRNRASIIIWSVGNETPVSEARTRFMSTLVQKAKALDNSRLVSAALEVHYPPEGITLDDPLGNYTDLVAANEYLGWYGNNLPSGMARAKWIIKFDKPFFFSETGAEALGGFYADSLTRWSEDYQAWFYREQIAMMKRMPEGFSGFSPWILHDFRSPRRNNPVYQKGWNNKGVYDQKGRKKKSFYVLKAYYDEMQKQHGF